MKKDGVRVFRWYVFLVGLFVGNLAFAQNTPQFTQYYFDPLHFNPAIAGIDQGLSATVIYRQQFFGLAGAPTTGLLNVHAPIEKFKSGLGLTVLSDRIGNFNTIQAAPAYAYRIRRGVNLLQLGIAPVITSASVQDNWLSVDDRSLDPSIPNGGLRTTAIDFNAGIFYKAGKYFGGLSVTNLSGQYLKLVNLNPTRTLHAMAGYQFRLGFLPSADWTAGVLYKMPLGVAGAQWEVNLSTLLRDAVSLGATVRDGNIFAGIIGYQVYMPVGKLRLGYAFDYATGPLQQTHKGSHEIAINYQYTITKTTESERYKNVRFL
ncbi:MAG TPA: PorP/SprF family type IX secretion system membrane protein [Luteibaculaceae bacterium]|nr:PorP/SprF family type IX secretion system membrane protein [Luteibaculaceae bacterium]